MTNLHNGAPLSAEKPVFTPEGHRIRADVDELFAASDKITHSILHAIHAKAIRGIEYVKDESTGMWHAPTQETAETAPAEASAIGAMATEQLAELDPALIPTDLVDPTLETAA